MRLIFNNFYNKKKKKTCHSICDHKYTYYIVMIFYSLLIINLLSSSINYNTSNNNNNNTNNNINDSNKNNENIYMRLHTQTLTHLCLPYIAQHRTAHHITFNHSFALYVSFRFFSFFLVVFVC